MYQIDNDPDVLTRDYFSIQIISGNIKVELKGANVVKWSLSTSGENYSDDVWHILSIYQNGTADPTIFVDGKKPTQAFSVSTTKTAWLSTISSDGAEAFGYTGPFIGAIRRFEVLGPNSRADSYKDIFTFEEGGTSPTSIADIHDATNQFALNYTSAESEYDSKNWNSDGTPSVTATWGGTTPAPANISSEFRSRGYGAGSVALDGSTPRVEYTIAHMDPSFTSTLVGSKPFSTQPLISAQTYDNTKYEVDNKSDWVATNAGADHDTFGREDYPPPELGSGVASFALAENEEVTLGIEARHTHTATGNIHSPWVQVKIENTQGHIDLIDIILNTDEQPAYTGRGL